MFGFVSFHGAYRHFQQYFGYIVVVSFIGGGNRKTGRKPPTLSHNAVWSRFQLTTTVPVVIGTDCIDSCKSNYLTIMTTTVPTELCIKGYLQRETIGSSLAEEP